MKRTIIILLTLAAFVGGVSSTALAKTYKGTVTKVKGNKIVIEVSKKDAKKIAVGDKINLKVKKHKAAKAGADALTGC